MPVPTYVPTRGGHNQSGVVDGWNHPPSPPNPDVPAPRMPNTEHADDTDLYDRPDWPLPSPQPDRTMMNDPEDLGDQLVSTFHHEGASKSYRAIGGQMDGTAYLGEPDVSDIEEVSEEDDEEDADDGPIHTGTAQVAQRLNCRNSLRRPASFTSPLHSPRGPSSQRTRSSSSRSGHSISPVQDTTPEEPHLPLTPLEPTSGGALHTPYQVKAQEDEVDDSEVAIEERAFQEQTGSIRTAPDSPVPQAACISIPSSPQTHGSASQYMGNSGPLGSLTNSASSQWRMSIHNPLHTAHISHNHECIRYSWQSLPPDTSNRPRIQVIKLVSNTATASAGFPQGEAFAFAISPKGRRIAAYNSARLFVLQTAAFPTGISQDYALKRRPLAVELTDEARMLAILADDHTVNVYELGASNMLLSRTITLDFPANCIALAPTGGLLAASYEGGVEIFSLDPTALSTDRRAVRAVRMDRMMFSEDSSTLLGTTTRIHVASTVIVSVPIFPSAPNGIPTSEELKEAWCAGLLHPENIRHSSHATFMRESRGPCNDRLFAWNGLEDTFGILNVGGMQYENIDFPVIVSPPLSTCGGLGAAIHSCPSLDEYGNTVAMIVNDRTVRLYMVPHKDEATEEPVEADSIDHELDEGYGCPFNEVRWVHHASLPAGNHTNPSGQVRGRLIVTSPGGVMEHGMPEESVEDVEGGRILLFDFDSEFVGQPDQMFTLTLGRSPPQLLEEAQVDVEEAVALMRRRTVNQNKNTSLSQRPVTLGRSATMAVGANRLSRIDGPVTARPNSSRMSMMSLGSMQSDATRSLPDLLENPVLVQAVEEPYAQNAPRSQASLQRAATNAQRHRFQALEERAQEGVATDPEQSLLALPEYTEEPNAPLPSRFRAMAGLDLPARFTPPRPAIGTDFSNSDVRGLSSSSGSMTAPPDIGERFSADEAFQAANARTAALPHIMPASHSLSTAQVPDAHYAPIPPIPSAYLATNQAAPSNMPSTVNNPGQPTSSPALPYMPRGLRRVYSNTAINDMTSPSSITGSWVNLNTSMPQSIPEQGYPAEGTSFTPATATTGGETWDMISSIGGNRTAAAASSLPQRYSTSILNHPGQPPSTASSIAPSMSTSWQSTSSTRRAPPYTPSFRLPSATAPSLFPPSQPTDHVPFRRPTSSSGATGHRITGWHPPAPAGSPNAPRRSVSGKSHSRRNSVAGKSAFANTARAKKLGFFKRNRPQHDPYGRPTRATGDATAEGASVFETKSMMTWATKRDKCVLM